jgi:hypothetical protein
MLDLAEEWSPKEEGFRCLCITRRKLVTDEILRKHELDLDLCKTVLSDSTELTYARYLETISYSVLSFLFDFLFDYMSKVEAYTDYNDR